MQFLFSRDSILSRDNYIKFVVWSVFTAAVVFMFTAVYFTLIVAVTIVYGFSNITSISLTMLVAFFILFILLYTVVQFIVTVKRLRGAGKNINLIYLGFIGLFCIPFILGLVCADVK